ncbi:MAG: hypothetical protein J6X33_04720 [Clostridiales bacterium]|nr:hypothetical protein [Clostridiales bacterium]
MWKKNKFLLILLTLTLVLAILVTGFGWPGYMLGLIPKSQAASDTITSKAKAFSEGSSKAFSIEPVPGMTISAEENALDKDRTFKVKEANDKEFDRLVDQFREKIDAPAMVYGAWEVDAGLKDDESFPGTYNLSLDLEEFGVDEEDWENCRLYRIDDSGKWTEYSTSVDNGKLSMDSNQNSFVFWAIFTALMPVMVDEVERYNSNAYLMPELKSSLRQKNIDSFDVNIDGKKDRFRIILDIASVKEMVYTVGNEYKNAQLRVMEKAVMDAINIKVSDESIRKDIIAKIPEIQDPTVLGVELCKIMDSHKKKYADENTFKEAKIGLRKAAVGNLKKYTNEQPEVKQHLNFMNSLKEDKPTFETLKASFDQVNQVASYLEKTYYFIKDEINVQLPTTVIEVHLSDKTGSQNAGVAINPIFNYAKILNPKAAVVALGVTESIGDIKWEDLNILGNPALVISMDKVADRSQSDYDELLLTMCHELFHICQREYVMSIRANYCFDEMTAQSVEVDAYNYFLGNHTIQTTDHLDNLGKCQYYAVPLDSFMAGYPEGFIGTEDGWDKPLFGKGANVSYGRAGFFIYLKDKFKPSYDTVLRRYKSLWGKRAVTTILKTVFGEESDALKSQPDKALSHYYYHFITSQKTTDKLIAKANSQGQDIFSPKTTLGAKDESLITLHYDYSTRVRRLLVKKLNEKDKQYAIVARKPWFTNSCADLRLKPANMVKDKDYVELKDGVFIKPRDYPKDLAVPACYMMEVICGDYTPPQIVHSQAFYGYNICLLTPIQEPEMETKNGVLKIKEIKRLDYRKDYVDRVVATITLGKDTLLTASSTYNMFGTIKDWQIDLSDLKHNGKALTSKEKKELKITFRECVTGTFDLDNLDNACLGPGEPFKVPVDFDITGTYNSQASLSDFSLGEYATKMVGGLAEMIARMFGADPSDEDIQNAVDGSVEINAQELSYSQIITIELIKDNRYKVEMDADIGKFSYEGTLNEDLTLSLKLKGFTPKYQGDGNGLDVTDDFFAKIELQFQKDDSGEPYIDGSYVVTSNMINGTYTCRGTKIPEE